MKSATAIQKVVKVLLEAGPTGIRRHELRAQAELPAQALNDVLRFLRSRDELREVLEEVTRERDGAFLRGRPATRYFYEPTDEFLPNELPAAFCTPKVQDPSTAPTTHGVPGPSVCTWCRGPLPIQHMGRPRQFCKPECRVASALAAGMQLLRILQRPKDPFVFNAVARMIVAADLMSHGLRIHSTEGLGYMVAERGTQFLRVGVYVADERGDHFEGEDGADVRAIVRRDGEIRYTGIVFDEEPQKTEPPGVDETTGGEEQRVR